MSCCLYWVILEECLSVRVLASAVDDSSSYYVHGTNTIITFVDVYYIIWHQSASRQNCLFVVLEGNIFLSNVCRCLLHYTASNHKSTKLSLCGFIQCLQENTRTPPQISTRSTAPFCSPDNRGFSGYPSLGRNISWAAQSVVSSSSPVTGLEWLSGFQEVKVPRFHDNGTGWW